MNLDFTIVDVAVILVIILSTIYAAYRGFVNETLSIFAWAAAAFATLYFAPEIAPFLRARISTPLVGTLIAYAGIFLAVLGPLSFVSYRFSENVKHSPVGVFDRGLGVVFGVVRGLALVGIAYIVFSMFVPIREHPRWVRQARLLPLVQASSDALLALVPNQQVTMESNPAVAPRVARTLGRAKHRRETYGAGDRRALDNLIETTGNGNAKP